jgi:hypothetical protein
MKKIILAACCVALMGSVTAVTTAQARHGMTSSMDSNARMMKKHKMKKGMMKRDGMMKSDSGMMKGGESKDGMGMSKKGGMSK